MKPVFVTTCPQGRLGFWFGYVEDNFDVFSETLHLKNAKSVRYLKCAKGGLLGATVYGPDSDSKIGPTMKEVYINNVTAIVPLEKEAEEKWLEATWE